MGAAMTGLRPVAEMMFSDFFAVCWDLVVNEIAKARYMTDGQVRLPLVIRTANGGGIRFGAQHSQSVENWAMTIPGLKVVAPSTPADIVGPDGCAAIRDPDPVIVFEHKALSRPRARCPTASTSCRSARRPWSARAATARSSRSRRWSRGAVEAAERLAAETGSTPRSSTCARSCRWTSPTILDSVAKTGRLFTVEENPRLCGWGAEIVSIVADEGF